MTTRKSSLYLTRAPWATGNGGPYYLSDCVLLFIWIDGRPAWLSTNYKRWHSVRRGDPLWRVIRRLLVSLEPGEFVELREPE